MRHFPIFLDMKDRHVVVAGGGNAAVAKLRLLLKTDARVTVFADRPAPEIEAWAAGNRVSLIRRAIQSGDVSGKTLLYAANEDKTEDARAATIARAEGAFVNVVDNLRDSDFITPAIVDRDPVTVAIGTEGTAPVLARAVKTDLEARLPATLGILAGIGKTFRSAANSLPVGRARRDFWGEYFFRVGPRAVKAGGTVALRPALARLLDRHLAGVRREGHVTFVGAGPGDPELLTLKARKALDEADVVLHDRLVTQEILELVRREALVLEVGKTAFGQATRQEDINTLLVEHARNCQQVVRLKSGDAAVFGRLDEEIEACEAAGIAWDIIPGITAVSAAAVGIGQSLTRRGRNTSIHLLAGHDANGFAEHDWAALARPGEIAAIYMGKAAARYFQGRLIMHGAAHSTPITLVENASRPEQRVVSTTLGNLPFDLTRSEMDGPVLILYGLAAREAQMVQPIPYRESA